MKTYATLVLAFLITLPQSVRADKVTPPLVPLDIEAPAGVTPFFVAHAVGTQGYICAPEGAGVNWVPSGPQATLFDDRLKQVLTHYLSPNPLEGGVARATWQHSRDTSTVWAQSIASSTDPAFVAPGAIAWLLLRVAGAADGPTGGHTLAAATFIHRVGTVGGQAPATGCATLTDLFRREWVPYEADYYFYR